jgi:hypothetical protein
MQAKLLLLLVVSLCLCVCATATTAGHWVFYVPVCVSQQ